MQAKDILGPGRRLALAVVTGRYRHDELPNLDSPANDAAAVERVLGSPDIGRFESVEIVLNKDAQTAKDRIYDFFADAERDDFLFVYLSCHGRKDGSGRLYLTAIDTNPARLPPTAIAADYVRALIDECDARQVVLVVDCCFAGAFGTDLRQRANGDRIVVLTANAIEYAHEGEQARKGIGPSLFARAFFEGIETGGADSDVDGRITVREAFDYAAARLREMGARQTPQMRTGTTGDLVLCRAPSRPGSLPADVTALLRNSLPAARKVAVEEMSRWLLSGEPERIQTAEQTLSQLRTDPDEKVAQLASKVLARRYSTVTLEPPATVDRVAVDDDKLWFTRAIFYEIRVRSFADANGDGLGDLHGLVGKLDYLQWLNINCLILTPIFDSPLQNDGYDGSDFMAIHADLGGTADLIELIDAAHRRGIRVVLDFVLNHTSNKHVWFEESRREPHGPHGDFYVWSDTDDLFADASGRIDGPRQGGWTYDPVRRQYYWHRFASYEPDLNFDNPAVQDAIMRVLYHWLEQGIDGYRLVTAPFLYERDGTECEGLSETHAYLRRLREEIDAKYTNKVLLAWTDHWPSEAAEYFGNPVTGKECDMVLYTSLMPRIFLAMRRSDHAPVSRILGDAPTIDQESQWGIYLRNGDEMSLDLLRPDECAYLMREYAPLPRMSNTVGIRRRLAPLLDGSVVQIQMCFGLLMSLPGAPVIYYGDEIGMGENLMLPGKAALRTPMQWSPDRGGGFSDAEPEQFVLPLILSSNYGYQVVNVESQIRTSDSLLQENRRLIEIRRNSAALTSGTFEPVDSANPAVMAYMRAARNDRMLCIVNFSRYPQATALNLTDYAGVRLVESTGGSNFGMVRDVPYLVSLAGYGFFWLEMREETQ
jgi:trehalose synthase